MFLEEFDLDEKDKLRWDSMKSSKLRWLYFSMIALCVAFLALLSNQYKKNEKMSSRVVTIKFGAEGRSDATAQGFSLMNHPSGVYAYTAHWDDRHKLGLVKYVQEKHSFDLDNALIVTGLGDKDSPEDGVDNWDISFNPSSSRLISYEEARDKIAGLLDRLRSAGWVRYIETSEPRLVGKEAMIYALTNSGVLYSIDSTYTPSIAEWKSLMAVEPRWYFYADGIFLTLSVSYLSSGADGMGYYLSDLQVSTASDNYSPYFSDSIERRRNWKKYLSDELRPAVKERSKREAELKAQGYSIDMKYQAPPFEAPDFSAMAGDAH
ncbi:TPA: hypothetical protein QDC20_002633 [Burkholderia aenigmatica]|uniref:hypothetical protein n=1 Tax=Burkholderia sp. AU45251 TaxID=3059204 RepID=UPI002651172A|nr:hypothetical protein [Burkholderia sp. AU45251]HDR9484509.1 hypothetical protein [Burkholderia aenigmatica]MDN7516893.1 hypothetical protein [Burkholderia sp. AU45251]HDR9515785.1 hypothetical protein [Burkholderia aenigmatica]HDR9592594.1 hypothetical protein [Burkholderia aenigmatica]HDR9599574.1 hypothetical protein [Burkholderia aenigmatica]